MDISYIQKIALTGKANSGKNTTATLLTEYFYPNKKEAISFAFADPIKEMLLIMFPWADKECLYGPSKLRNNIIPNAFDKSGKSLTYRQVLIDIGRQGREYNEDHWVQVYDHRIKQLSQSYYGNKNYDLIIVTDVRYPNEFSYLKQNGYFLIKVIRNSDIIINDSSETNQDQIKDNEFDYLLDNNGTPEQLKMNVSTIVQKIQRNNSASLYG